MNLFIFYDCNQWHEYSSMRFILVCDSKHYDLAYEKIKNEREYTDEEMQEYIHINEVILNDFDSI